ncbi:MAG: MFS transporter [Deltaproteobacteria bacterium]|nr:MFS transporter [Deltaproteobacteria bacterium]
MFKKLPLFVRHTFYYDLKAAMFFGIFGGAFLPFIAIVGRKIGATEFQIALLMAAPYIANTFALLWTEDILGKGRIWYVVWPNAIGRAALISMFFVTTPFAYTLTIFIYMLITAIPFPSYASVMKTNYPDKERGRLMSYIRIGTACFWIAASTIAGWILEKGTENYHYLFPAAALFGILSALEFRNIRVRREHKDREGFAAFSHITAPFKNRPFIRFLTAYSVFEFGLLLALPLFPLIQVDKAHIPNLVAGVFGTVFSGMWLAGFFFWGRFIDKHPLSSLLALLFLCASGLPLIYLLTYNLWFLGIAQGIAGFIFAAIELVGYVVITRMASPKETPRYMAVHTVLGGVRGATAPFLGPVIMNKFGADAAFAVSTAFMIFALVFIKGMKGKLSAQEQI